MKKPQKVHPPSASGSPQPSQRNMRARCIAQLVLPPRRAVSEGMYVIRADYAMPNGFYYNQAKSSCATALFVQFWLVQVIMATRGDPLGTLEEKKKCLEDLRRENALLCKNKLHKLQVIYIYNSIYIYV